MGFSSVAVPAAQRDLPQLTLRLLCIFCGYVCLSCSGAGDVGWAAAFPFGFSVLSCAGWLACEGGSAIKVMMAVWWCLRAPQVFFGLSL